MKRKRHTQAEVARIVAAYRKSGLSVPKFAQKNGISSGTLYNWLGKTVGQAAVVEVRARPPVVPSNAHCQFQWPDGRKLEFPADLPSAQLGEFVRALRGAK
jgi:hypothetical protein